MSGRSLEFNTGPNKRTAVSSATLPSLSTRNSLGTAGSSFASTTTTSTSNSTVPGLSFGAGSGTSSSFNSGLGSSTTKLTGFGSGNAGSTSTSIPGSTSGASATTTAGSGSGIGFGKFPSTSNSTGFNLIPGATSSSSATAVTGSTSATSTFGFGASNSTASGFGSSTSSSALPTGASFLGTSGAFKPTLSGFNPSTSSHSQERSAYPNLSIGCSPADLKYAELEHKAFCMTQEHTITPDTLVADLPQDAKNIFSQIEQLRTKEINHKASLINNMRALGPSLGYVASDCDEMGDSPLPIEDKISILLKELKDLKLKLQKDDAAAKKRSINLEADKQTAKKVQQKLVQLKAQPGTTADLQNLNPLGNVPFTQLINPYAYGSLYGCNMASFSDPSADSAYDGLEYFMQLYVNLQTQFTSLKAELQKFETAMDTAAEGSPPQAEMDELVEKTFALSRREMSLRTRLFSALQAANLSYPVPSRPPEPKDLLELGNLLFQPHHVPKAGQDDVLFEIANVECKPADLSKLKRK